MNHDYRYLFNRYFLYGVLLFAFIGNAQAYNKVPASYQGSEVRSYTANCRIVSMLNGVPSRTYYYEGNASGFNAFKAWCHGGKAVHGDNHKTGVFTGGASGYLSDFYYCPPPGKESYVIGPDADNMCTDIYMPEPPPVTCSSPEVNKEVQVAQWECEMATPNPTFYDTKFEWSCKDVIGQNPNLSTSCNYEPNGCIVGLNCGGPDKDVPMCNPLTEECEIPLPSPDEVEPSEPPSIDPDEAIDFCKLNPDLCEDPSPDPDKPPTTPDIPDIPKPEPDPDLSEGDNSIVGELVITNEHLKNIRKDSISSNNATQKQLELSNKLAQHQLGALKEIAKKPTGGGAGTTEAVQAGNEKLDEIACLLDEGCEGEGKEKPTADTNCESNTFSCKGDVIQCEILRIQHEERCVGDDLAKLEDSFESITGVDNEKMLVDTSTVYDYSQMDTKYLDDGVSFGRSSCPAPANISLNIPTVGNYQIDFSYEPACQWAGVMNPLVHIAGWVLGLFIIFRAGGGQ